MANKKDYYELLGVGRDANEAQLKKAYRAMAKKHHPDNNLDNKTAAEEKMKEINEAYSILSDSGKRKTYDQFGHAAFEQGGGAGGFHGGVDFSDIIGSFFGGGGGMDFGDIFGGGGRSRPRPRRGADLQSRLNIKFEEAVFGATKEVQLQSYEACSTCSGSGAKPGTFAESCKKCNGTGSERITQQSFMGIMTKIVPCTACKGEGRIIKDVCTTCRGQGRVRTTKTLEVTVPKGIDNGQSIRLGGKGEMGEKGAPPGDLYITVAVSPHKLFTRDGLQLHLEIPITFVQAALGDEISVPLLDGESVKHKITAGTQPGTIVQLRGKGVPNVHNPRSVGDLIVKLNVTVPTALNDKQKEILRGFNDAMGEDYVNHKKKWLDKVKGYFG
ncbi:MAG: molecular chaperone DnaJ [Defluviitaleaceae bacterium]|nr:molecular chaperone DnaJ [Defluviitaleaceae bacterium]